MLVHIESFEACFYLFILIITQLCNFLFSLKILCNPFKKLTHPIMQPLFEITTQSQLLTTDFLLKSFPLHFGGRGACHNITKSNGSQKNNKFSDNDRMTAE